MPYANCHVTISPGKGQCNPDPVPVTKGTEDGITWTFVNPRYTFTGVKIDGKPAPTGNFGPPQFSTNPAGRSVMEVSDSVATIGEFPYTLQYLDDKGQPGELTGTVGGILIAPQIKNQN